MVTQSHPAVAALDEQAALIAIRVQRQAVRRSMIALLCMITGAIVAVWASSWWSQRLSPEEQSALGRWVAIDTLSRTSPKGTSSLTCYRELKLLAGHEVQMRVWAQGDPKQVEMIPLFGGRGYLLPLEAVRTDTLTMVPYPAVLPSSIDSTSAAPVNATGRWTIKDGRIEIEWNLDNSPLERIRKKYSEVVRGVQTIYISKKASGDLTQDQDGRLTIHWDTKPSRASRYIHPPQAWTRQK